MQTAREVSAGRRKAKTSRIWTPSAEALMLPLQVPSWPKTTATGRRQRDESAWSLECECQNLALLPGAAAAALVLVFVPLAPLVLVGGCEVKAWTLTRHYASLLVWPSTRVATRSTRVVCLSVESSFNLGELTTK